MARGQGKHQQQETERTANKNVFNSHSFCHARRKYDSKPTLTQFQTILKTYQLQRDKF